MDDAARIEAFKAGLRIMYGGTPPDIVGLRRRIAAMMNETDGAANDSVIINSASFEGEQSSGQVTLEPLAKLQALTEVLAELDPDNMPESPALTRHADFSLGILET